MDNILLATRSSTCFRTQLDVLIARHREILALQLNETPDNPVDSVMLATLESKLDIVLASMLFSLGPDQVSRGFTGHRQIWDLFFASFVASDETPVEVR